MKPVRFTVVSALLCVTMLLPACMGVAQRQDLIRERYHSYAGAPIEEFTWLGRYYSFEPLGNDELVVFTTPFDGYLLRVLPPCIDLPFTQAIGLTSTARTVSRHFDFVLVHRTGQRGRFNFDRCPIAEIRPVDYQRMRRDIRENGPLKGAPAEHARPVNAQGQSTV